MARNADDPLLSAGEAAEMLGVHIETVRRNADKGRLRSSRTLGGHRRFRRSEIQKLLAKWEQEET